MGNINPQFNDRIQYTLRNKDMGDLIIVEPIGWNDDEKEYSRHEVYDGVFPRFSNSLKFIEDAAEYIQMVYDIYGIMADIELKRQEKHPQTDVWTLTYTGYLDLTTWSTENKQVLLKFNSGGLEQELKARESENIEVDRTTTFNDTVIPELNTIDVQLDGRRIFLQTKYDINKDEDTIVLRDSGDDNAKRGSIAPAPIALVNKSHENAQTPIYTTIIGDNSGDIGTGNDREGNGSAGLMFFRNSDKERDLSIKFKFNFKITLTEWDDVNSYRFWARLVKYKDGEDYTFKEHTVLFTGHSYNSLNGNDFGVSFNQTINLLQGESLGLVFDHCARLGSSIYDGLITTTVKLNKIDYMTVEEDSDFDVSTTKAILAHELAERLVTIDTNKKGSFYSEYFGRMDLGYAVDGPGAYIGFTHGFWVRKFDKFPVPKEATNTESEVTNLFKPLTTSFKDFMTSNEAILNIGMGIEVINNVEKVRIEEKSYFYNRNVTIRLPNQVKNVKRSVATDKYYSAVEIGYEKGGDYEEAFGLDEFNVKSNFSTIISKLKNVYIQISKYRSDSYGMEFARRKPKIINETEDTTYDEDVFFLDLKKDVSGTFLQRKWQNDCEKIPTGIFSPETATNLRLSPVNSLLRHGWWISASVIKYATNKLKFGSSTSNRQLKTKLDGKNEYAENDDIINSELETARFIPEYIEFEHACDFDIMQQVNGYTVILGKKILNLYGLIEFINEDGEIERAFFINLKPNGKGQWKVLKANR